MKPEGPLPNSQARHSFQSLRLRQSLHCTLNFTHRNKKSQCMHKRNIEVHCCLGKIRITPFLVYVYSAGYPACNGLSSSKKIFHITSHTHKGIFMVGGMNIYIKLNTKKCVFWFYQQLLMKTLLTPRTEGDMIKHEYWSSCTVLVFMYSTGLHVQ